MDNTVEHTPVYISDLGKACFLYRAAVFKHSTQGENDIKENC